MRKIIWWLIAIFGIGVFVFIIYRALERMRPEPEPQLPPPVVVPAAPAEPQIRYPVEQQPQEKPLPALDVSDATMQNALGELSLDRTLSGLFQMKDFIRRVVATIDNLPRQKLALRLMPVKPAGGKFLAIGKDESLAIGPDNAARYAPYVRLASTVDTAKLVAFYVHFYPLFQQAYRDLGYPKGYFNDRLIEVIDHLLATPEVPVAAGLVQPKVFYLFADPELEARSAGEKILMRIGSGNAVLIKAKLREIRGELVRQAPKR
jgi:hypothetical protein